MSTESWNFLIIFAILITAIVRFTLNLLDAQSARLSLDSAADESITRAVQYTEAKHSFENMALAVRSLLIVLAIQLDVFGMLQQLASKISPDALWRDFTLLAAISIAFVAVGLPFSIYKTFVLEARFGFNLTTTRTFFTDRIRVLLLALVLLAPVALLLIWVYQQIPGQIWWIAFLLISIINVLAFAFGTSVILPIFNKLEKLNEGVLATKIRALSENLQYKIKQIYVMDSSKRSSKTNAFFSGFGSSRVIVLFDSLIEKHPAEEVVAVLGHEVGHDRLGHLKTNLALSTVQNLILFAAFGWIANQPAVSAALGGSEGSLVLALVGFWLLITPVNIAMRFLNNYFLRKNELSADFFAARNCGKENMQAALMRLGRDNLSNPNPHPWYVAAYYSHPPVGQRIRALEQFQS